MERLRHLKLLDLFYDSVFVVVLYVIEWSSRFTGDRTRQISRLADIGLPVSTYMLSDMCRHEKPFLQNKINKNVE